MKSLGWMRPGSPSTTSGGSERRSANKRPRATLNRRGCLCSCLVSHRFTCRSTPTCERNADFASARLASSVARCRAQPRHDSHRDEGLPEYARHTSDGRRGSAIRAPAKLANYGEIG
jgi:hypothetical protein